MFLTLLFAEVPTVLVALGAIPVFPDQGPVRYDLFWVAVTLSILVVCDLLAAYMTFYLKVSLPQADEDQGITLSSQPGSVRDRPWFLGPTWFRLMVVALGLFAGAVVTVVMLDLNPTPDAVTVALGEGIVVVFVTAGVVSLVGGVVLRNRSEVR